MGTLGEALERSRGMIKEALADARTELATVQARAAELEAQIAQAEAVLSGGAGEDPAPSDRTLHEALSQVLREGNNEGMTARELADVVNTRGLYRKRDGSPVEANQVQARVNNYGELFEKAGSKIRLRTEPSVLSDLSPALTVFRDDDEGFLHWQAQHPHGFLINTERNPKPSYLVLHRPECVHLTGEKLQWTKDYIKVCSDDRDALEAWATDTVGGQVAACRTCVARGDL